MVFSSVIPKKTFMGQLEKGQKVILDYPDFWYIKSKKGKMVHLYSTFSMWICSKVLYNDQVTPSGPEALIQSGQCMLVLILPTLEGWKAEWTLAGKEVSQIFDPRPGRGSNLGPQDWEAQIFATAPTPLLISEWLALNWVQPVRIIEDTLYIYDWYNWMCPFSRCFQTGISLWHKLRRSCVYWHPWHW